MGLPAPYYDDGKGIVIYHGDCRAILPHLAPVDLVLTDPPYSQIKGGMEHSPGGVGRKHRRSETVGQPWGDTEGWESLAWEKAEKALFVFCCAAEVPEVALMFPREARVSLLAWYKRNAPAAVCNVPRFTTEYIWALRKSPGLDWRAIKSTMIDEPNCNAGCMATERILNLNGTAAHPTQNPLAVIRTLLAVGGETILDPFMGSGTTLVAARDLGRKCIGIEIEEKYCEIAARRLSQQLLPFGEEQG